MKAKSATTKASSTKRAPAAKNSIINKATAFINDCEHALTQVCQQLDKHYAKASEMIQAEAKQLKTKLEKAKTKLLASKKQPAGKAKSKSQTAAASKQQKAASAEHNALKSALEAAEHTLATIKNQHKRHEARKKALTAFEKQWEKIKATASKKKKTTARKTKAKKATAAPATHAAAKAITVKKATSSKAKTASKKATPRVAKVSRARRPLATAHTSAQA